MKILSIVILSLMFHLAYGQVQKASAMEEVFQKEFSVYPDSNIGVYLITPPVVLPIWFFNPPQGNKDVFYAVGISDPWIDKERGNKQAKNRAFCLASFMNSVEAKGVSDIYIGSDQNSKFEQISCFIALPNADIECMPVDSFVTKYQELVMLYKITVGKVVKENGSFIEYYKSVVRQDAAFSKLEKFELYGKTDESIFRYEYALKDNDYEILSVFNSDTILIKPTIYQYSERKKSNETDSIAEISLFKKGLWQGFFKSMIDQLDMTASEIQTRQKMVSENHQKGKESSFNQLNRGVYNTSFSFAIASIELANKEMIINLKTIKNQ